MTATDTTTMTEGTTMTTTEAEAATAHVTNRDGVLVPLVPGQEYALVAAKPVRTESGGRVFWNDDVTRVRLDRLPFSREGSVRCTRLNGTDQAGGSAAQMIDATFLAPLPTVGSPARLTDTGAEALRVMLHDSDLWRDSDAWDTNTACPDDWTGPLQDRFIASVRSLVESRRTDFGSYEEAGRLVLGGVQDLTWESSDAEVLGRWLAGQRDVLLSLPVMEHEVTAPTGEDTLAGPTVLQVRAAWEQSPLAERNDGTGRYMAWPTWARDCWVDALTEFFRDPARLLLDDYGLAQAFFEVVRARSRQVHGSPYFSHTTGSELRTGVWLRAQTTLWGRAGVPEVAAAGVTPLAPVISVGGTEYVRRDVVDRDVTRIREVFHEAARANSLCHVYDRVVADYDDGTGYIKINGRPRTFHVTIAEEYVVRRTVTVTAVNEAQARDQALSTRAQQPALVRGVDLAVRAWERTSASVVEVIT